VKQPTVTVSKHESQFAPIDTKNKTTHTTCTTTTTTTCTTAAAEHLFAQCPSSVAPCPRLLSTRVRHKFRHTDTDTPTRTQNTPPPPHTHTHTYTYLHIRLQASTTHTHTHTHTNTCISLHHEDLLCDAVQPNLGAHADHSVGTLRAWRFWYLSAWLGSRVLAIRLSVCILLSSGHLSVLLSASVSVVRVVLMARSGCLLIAPPVFSPLVR
jgi:hypothetical protein